MYHFDPYVKCLKYKYSSLISSPSSAPASKILGLGANQRTSKCLYEPTPFKAQHAHSVSTSHTCVMGFLSTNMWCNMQGYFPSSGFFTTSTPACHPPWNAVAFLSGSKDFTVQKTTTSRIYKYFLHLMSGATYLIKWPIHPLFINLPVISVPIPSGLYQMVNAQSLRSLQTSWHDTAGKEQVLSITLILPAFHTEVPVLGFGIVHAG